MQFPFSDLSETKLRPAVALANAVRADWVLCQATSKPYGSRGRFRLSLATSLPEIRRFLLHILTAGFVRIRQFGFPANRARREKLVPTPLSNATVAYVPDRKTDEKRCPVCRTGHMILIRLFHTERLAGLPPLFIGMGSRQNIQAP